MNHHNYKVGEIVRRLHTSCSFGERGKIVGIVDNTYLVIDWGRTGRLVNYHYSWVRSISPLELLAEAAE